MTAKVIEALAAGLVEVVRKALVDPTHRITRLETERASDADRLRALEARILELEADRASVAAADLD